MGAAGYDTSSNAWADLAAPILREAAREAECLGHPWIGPEHLLIGIASVADPTVRVVLERFGLTPAALRQALSDVLGAISEPGSVSSYSISDRTIAALRMTAKKSGGAPYADSMLLGVLLSNEIAQGAVIEAVLHHAGVPLDVVQAFVE